MDIEDLINYLRLEGPHDLESVPTTSEEDALPPGNELTDEEGDLEGVEANPVETNPRVEDDLVGDPNAEEPIEDEDPEEDPNEDPEENPSEGEPMEEEDPEEDLEGDPKEDSEMSEG